MPEWLDFVEIPWRLTREHLADHHGVTRHPAYNWDVIQIAPSTPPLSGLTSPISAQAFETFCPWYPATEFAGATHFKDDARYNIKRTADELAEKLGPTKIVSENNVLTCRWVNGRSRIKLTAWPSDKQGFSLGPNPAHQRDPRLVEGCHVSIQTGYLPAFSATERAWIERFQPIAALSVRTPEIEFEHDAPQTQLEFIREPQAMAHLSGQLGVSDDGAALVFYSDFLYVISTHLIVDVQLDRVLPAKGSGGSYVSIRCRTNYPSAPDTKSVSVASADGADDLTELAKLLAQTLDKPLAMPDYDYDC